MTTKAKSGLGRSLAMLLTIAMLVGLLSVGAFAVQAPENDFIYSPDATVSSLGGTVTFTVSLPANMPFRAYTFSMNQKAAEDLGCTVTSEATAVTDWGNAQSGNYLGLAECPTYYGNYSKGTEMKFDANQQVLKYTIDVPAGLDTDTVIEFTANKNCGTFYNGNSYFDSSNSDYKNDDRVVFSIKVEDHYTVDGEDFDAITGTKLTLADVLTKGNVKATAADGTDYTLVESDLDAAQWALIKTASASGAVGAFKLTLNNDSASDEITVNLWNHDSTDPKDPTDPTPEDPEVHGWIRGNDFTAQTGGAAFTWDEITTAAKLTAQSANGVTYLPLQRDADATQLAALNAAKIAGKVGDYHLVITTPDGADADLIITLKDSVIVDPKKGMIDSNNFQEETGAPLLTEDNILARGSVTGKDINGISYAVNTTNFTVNQEDFRALQKAENNEKIGSYNVRVTNPLQAETTVVVTLIKTDLSALTVESFSAITGTELTVADVATKGKVDAANMDGTDHALVEADLDPAEWALLQKASAKGAVGTYPLTITVGSQEKTIQVTLWNHDSKDPDDPSDEDDIPEDPDTKGNIKGNDFTYQTGGAAFTWNEFKTAAKLVAVNKRGYAYSTAVTNAKTADWNALNAAKVAGEIGDYSVKVTIPDGADVIILVTLKDHVEDEDPTKGTISCNDFSEVTGGDPLTPDDVLTKGHVGGVDTDGIPYDPTDFTVDEKDLKDLNAAKTNGETGEFPVKVTNPDLVTETIMVTLEAGTTTVMKYDFNRDNLVNGLDMSIASDMMNFVKSTSTEEEAEFIAYLFSVDYENGTGDTLVNGLDMSHMSDQMNFVEESYTVEMPNELMVYFTSLGW